MDEETAAAANVDPDAVVTGEAIDKGLDVSRVEATANADAETATPGEVTGPGDER